MRVVFVGTEVAPFSKVGGLADVMAGLPVALAKRGHRVMTVTPRYAAHGAAHDTGVRVPLELSPKTEVEGAAKLFVARDANGEGGGEADGGDWQASSAPSLSHVFVDHELFFERGIYAEPSEGADKDASGTEDGGGGGSAGTDEEGGDEGADDAEGGEAGGAESRGADDGEDRRVGEGSEEPRDPLTDPKDASASPRAPAYPPSFPPTTPAPAPAFTYLHGPESGARLDERYSILCQAALAAPVLLWPPGPEPVVFVANDWPASLSLIRLKHAILDRLVGRGDAQAPPSCARSHAPPPEVPSGIHATEAGRAAAAGRAVGRGETPPSADEGHPRVAPPPAGSTGRPAAAPVEAAPTAQRRLWPKRGLRGRRARRADEAGGSGGGRPVRRGASGLRAAPRRSHEGAGTDDTGPQGSHDSELPGARGAGTQGGPDATGPTPAALLDRLRVALAGAVGVMAIHNLAFQGTFRASSVGALALPLAAERLLVESGDSDEPGPGSVRDVQGGSDSGQGEVGRVRGDEELGEHEGQETEGGGGRIEGASRGASPSRHVLPPLPPLADLDLSEDDFDGSFPLPEKAEEAEEAVEVVQTEEAKGRIAGRRSSTADADLAAHPPDPSPAAAEAPELPPPAAAPDALTGEAAAATPAGPINLLRAGLISADAVLTVSPTYAREIVEDEGGAGCGLSDILRRGVVTGILNGVDESWDPERDPHLPPALRYTAATAAVGKSRAKAALQRQLGLEADPDAPLFVFIGRLTEQKGIDVLLQALPRLLLPDAEVEAGLPARVPDRRTPPRPSAPLAPPPPRRLQLVLLGAGDAGSEAALRGLSSLYPGRAVGLPVFSEPLGRLLLAAGDFALLPSRFEPCGLVARCALRYGALPLAADVGGLRDLVGTAAAPGRRFGPVGRASRADERTQASVELAQAIRHAASGLFHPDHAAQVARAMAIDPSWDYPAGQWEEALWEAIRRPGGDSLRRHRA